MTDERMYRVDDQSGGRFRRILEFSGSRVETRQMKDAAVDDIKQRW